MNLIKKRRLNKNWRIKYVAEKINVTISTIQKIETGKRKPSYDVLIKLCKLFEVNYKEIEQLFAVTDDISNK